MPTRAVVVAAGNTGIAARNNMMQSVATPTVALVGALLAVASVLAFAPLSAYAAHAGAPYVNVNPRNDWGNDTGDSQIEGLNERQLDQNYWRNAQQPGGVPNPPYYYAPHR